MVPVQIGWQLALPPSGNHDVPGKRRRPKRAYKNQTSMRRPKSIKGYLSALRELEATGLTELVGYDKLNDEQKQYLGIISAELSNTLADFDRATPEK